MTAGEALRRGTALLADAGIERPRFEARLLLGHLLGVGQETVLARPGAAVDQAAYAGLLARRTAREPLAFITGAREFWSLPIAVSPATLIPRPDSETLIAAALTAFKTREQVRSILDLGVGTGCLLLAALAEFPSACGVGVDLVPAAAALAARNAATLGLAGRAAFLAGHWGDALAGRFDLILCNPPYVPTAAIPGLMREVGGHEPASALDGGADGLDAYRAVAPELDRLLAPGGVAILELGIGQAGRVSALAARHGFEARARPDLAGLPRALVLRRSRS